MSDNVHLGHRSRMRRKFSEYGDRFFDDYELLEMLLYFSIPVRDTNPISKKLLARFGSLDGVLSASIEELEGVEGIGRKTAEVIHLAGQCRKMTDSENCGGELLDTYAACGDFAVEKFSGRDDFSVALLSLDSKLRLLRYEELYALDYSSGGVRADSFADKVIKNRASVAIIIHNHPHGPLYPTEGDLQTNKIVADALSDVGVILAEHYIVCGDRYLGFMNHINSALSKNLGALDYFVKSKADQSRAES